MHTLLFALCLFAAAEESSAAAPPTYKGEPITMLGGFAVLTTFINGEGPFHIYRESLSKRKGELLCCGLKAI